MSEKGLNGTNATWLERKLLEGREGRLQAYRHIASVYARPLAAYMRESPWRWLGDIRNVALRFFAERVFRKDFLLRWVRRDVPLRRWLVKAFAYYLVELSRERGNGNGARRAHFGAASGNPELAYHKALGESLVRVALAKAREDCKRRGMAAHWKLFYEHYWLGRPYREILAELAVDPVQAAGMVHGAIERFRAALRGLLEHDGLPEGSINGEIRALIAIGRREPKPLDRVERLLLLGLSGLKRPVDELIERLRRPDGREWLARALELAPARRYGRPEDVLLTGKASLATLLSIKEEAKRQYRASARDPDAQLGAVATYFLSLASAFVNRGARIAGRVEEEILAAWLDLAFVAPAPWSVLLARAALGIAEPILAPSSTPENRSAARAHAAGARSGAGAAA